MTYYYLFYTEEIMLDKKKIQGIFLFKFKMDHKAVETTFNISNAFGSGTANEHIGQWWFKKFCKGDDSLKDEDCSGKPSEVGNNQLKGSSKHLAHELLMNVQCRGGSRSFAKEARALKMRSTVTGHQKLTLTN